MAFAIACNRMSDNHKLNWSFESDLVQLSILWVCQITCLDFPNLGIKGCCFHKYEFLNNLMATKMEQRTEISVQCINALDFI